jgi:predicted ribosomally synthesized peptide with nif11-like leader
MSLKDIKAFYERIKSDESFRDRILNVNSKEECSQIVRDAGYKFTQEEFEDYTAKLLESSADDDEFREVSDRELEAVVGGASSILGSWPPIQQKYGGIRPIHPPLQQEYGVVRSEE